MRSFFFLCLLSVLLSACVREGEQHRFLSLPAEGWERRDTQVFIIDDMATSGLYQLSVELRTVSQPICKRVAVAVEQQLETPSLSRTDTVWISLVDSVGRPQCPGVNLLVAAQPVATLRLTRGQHGTFRIRHLMRQELLPGITDVGFYLQAADAR